MHDKTRRCRPLRRACRRSFTIVTLTRILPLLLVLLAGCAGPALRDVIQRDPPSYSAAPAGQGSPHDIATAPELGRFSRLPARSAWQHFMNLVFRMFPREFY